MATVAEVKKRALQLLGITRINQAAQSQDDTRIATAYTEVYEDLKEEGLATWASTGTIPDGVVPHLVALMAFNAVDEYGVSTERYQRIVGRVIPATKEIRKLTTPKYESLEESTDY